MDTLWVPWILGFLLLCFLGSTMFLAVEIRRQEALLGSDGVPSSGREMKFAFLGMLLVASGCRAASLAVELPLWSAGLCPDAWGCTLVRTLPNLPLLSAHSVLALFWAQVASSITNHRNPGRASVFTAWNALLFTSFAVLALFAGSRAMSRFEFEAAVCHLLGFFYTTAATLVLFHGCALIVAFPRTSRFPRQAVGGGSSSDSGSRGSSSTGASRSDSPVGGALLAAPALQSGAAGGWGTPVSDAEGRGEVRVFAQGMGYGAVDAPVFAGKGVAAGYEVVFNAGSAVDQGSVPPRSQSRSPLRSATPGSPALATSAGGLAAGGGGPGRSLGCLPLCCVPLKPALCRVATLCVVCGGSLGLHALYFYGVLVEAWRWGVPRDNPLFDAVVYLALELGPVLVAARVLGGPKAGQGCCAALACGLCGRGPVGPAEQAAQLLALQGSSLHGGRGLGSRDGSREYLASSREHLGAPGWLSHAKAPLATFPGPSSGGYAGRVRASERLRTDSDFAAPLTAFSEAARRIASQAATEHGSAVPAAGGWGAHHHLHHQPQGQGAGGHHVRGGAAPGGWGATARQDSGGGGGGGRDYELRTVPHTVPLASMPFPQLPAEGFPGAGNPGAMAAGAGTAAGRGDVRTPRPLQPTPQLQTWSHCVAGHAAPHPSSAAPRAPAGGATTVLVRPQPTVPLHG